MKNKYLGMKIILSFMKNEFGDFLSKFGNFGDILSVVWVGFCEDLTWQRTLSWAAHFLDYLFKLLTFLSVWSECSDKQYGSKQGKEVAAIQSRIFFYWKVCLNHAKKLAYRVNYHTWGCNTDVL